MRDSIGNYAEVMWTHLLFIYIILDSSKPAKDKKSRQVVKDRSVKTSQAEGKKLSYVNKEANKKGSQGCVKG